MSFGVGGQGGFSLFTTVQAATLVYDPVVGSLQEQDGRFFYEVLPDTLRYLADYELLPHVWSGYMQVAADLYLSTFCADAARYLLEVPLDYQRKYQHITLDIDQDLSVDPVYSLLGQGAQRFLYNVEAGSVDAFFRNRLGKDGAFYPLRNRVDERAFLRFSWAAKYSLWEAGAYGFVGYFDSRTPDLANSLLVGVGDAGRVALVQFDGTGNANFVTSSPVLPLNIELHFSASYDPAQRLLTLSVVRMDTEAVILDGFSYILDAGAASSAFAFDSFGLLSQSLLRPSALQSGSLPGKQVAAVVYSLRYFDPSLESNVQDIPFLQDRWLKPTFFWKKDVDFSLVDHFLCFTVPPPSFVLAEYVSYDLGLIKKNFGLQVGLSGDNTEAYLRRVQGMHFVYWGGPTVENIRRGVSLLLGLPLSVEAGVVLGVNPAASAAEGEILIKGPFGVRSYRYPSGLDSLVVVGDEVGAFERLVAGVEVLDWKNAPSWFRDFVGEPPYSPSTGAFGAALGVDFLTSASGSACLSELQKYHTFVVRILSKAFDFSYLGQLRAFLDDVKPSWKTLHVSVLEEAVDDISISASLECAGSVAPVAYTLMGSSSTGVLGIDRTTLDLQEDDIEIAVIFTKSNTSVTSRDGMTLFGGISSSPFSLYLFWSRKGADAVNVPFWFDKDIFDGALWGGFICVWRGCVKTGSPIDPTLVSVAGGQNTDTITYADFDPTERCHVVAVGVFTDDDTSPAAISGSNPILDLRIAQQSAVGSDASCWVFSGNSDGEPTGPRSHSAGHPSPAGTRFLTALFGLLPAAFSFELTD